MNTGLVLCVQKERLYLRYAIWLNQHFLAMSAGLID